MKCRANTNSRESDIWRLHLFSSKSFQLKPFHCCICNSLIANLKRIIPMNWEFKMNSKEKNKSILSNVIWSSDFFKLLPHENRYLYKSKIISRIRTCFHARLLAITQFTLCARYRLKLLSFVVPCILRLGNDFNLP